MPPDVTRNTERTIEEKFRAKAVLSETNPALLSTNHRVLLGDARIMSELDAPESVHLVVTSPPYWTLKDYDGGAGDDQLGHVADYEAFQLELRKVWHRCFDLLVPGGRLCIVVGDVCLPRKKAGRHLVVPLHADISVHCREVGFDYLTPILWYKIANAATEVEGNGSPFLGKPYEPNGIVKNDVEYILLLRKPGGYRKPTDDQRLLSLIDKEDHAKWFRAIWSDVPGSSRGRGHPAPFPVELAYRLIRMFSFVGDTVLDPFLGTGTTTEAAMLANRCSVGYEIEEAYLQMIRERFEQNRIGAELQIALPLRHAESELEPRFELVGNPEQSGAVFLP
jgi:site-specific DNA-methyltransferase (adenine-specific)